MLKAGYNCFLFLGSGTGKGMSIFVPTKIYGIHLIRGEKGGKYTTSSTFTAAETGECVCVLLLPLLLFLQWDVTFSSVCFSVT